jgi:hypothetical protein
MRNLDRKIFQLHIVRDCDTIHKRGFDEIPPVFQCIKLAIVLGGNSFVVTDWYGVFVEAMFYNSQTKKWEIL